MLLSPPSLAMTMMVAPLVVDPVGKKDWGQERGEIGKDGLLLFQDLRSPATPQAAFVIRFAG